MRKYYAITNKIIRRPYGKDFIQERYLVNDLESADLVSSADRHTPGLHYPIFDIDFSAELLPSSTEGHFHLYLNRAVSWRHYKRIMRAMVKAGLLERGWYNCAKKDKQGYLRAPTVLKEESERTDEEVLATAEKLRLLEEELRAANAADLTPLQEKLYWDEIKRRPVDAEIVDATVAPPLNAYGSAVQNNKRVVALNPYGRGSGPVY